MRTPPESTLSVWAPQARDVGVVIGSVSAEPRAMRRGDDGWWRSDITAEHGLDYGFVVSGEAGGTRGPLPDPRSTRQPDGVHALSRVHRLDESAWTDAGWTGRQLAGSVIYELHVGTFTPGGTLDSAIGRLDELVDLGVTTVEVMPVAAFNGRHGWGYDGVLWFAVHEPYGGPDAMQRFVNACHARGLAVCLDVVYNHLGPSGNYLPEFGPYLSPADGPWGRGVNVDGPDSGEVRRLIVDNALYWFREFHVDALRLDAVHALHDSGAVHILEELAVETERLSAHLGRPLSLIAESDQNDPRLVTSREAGGYGLTGQWVDDLHHAVHAAVSGERQGYFADFGSLDALAKVLTRGFFHDGTRSSFRQRRHGRPLDTRVVPGSRLVGYTLTHDQVGNRAAGDRPSQSLTVPQLGAKAALVLCSAFTPMLFQGEEWGASTPFAFFSDHPEPELAEAVRSGRRREFAEMGWDPGAVADPQDPQTFLSSTLDWSERAASPHSEVLSCYRALLRLRREVPELADPWLADVRVEVGSDDRPDDRWLMMHRGEVALVVNLGDRPCRVRVGVGVGGYGPDSAGGGRADGVQLEWLLARGVHTVGEVHPLEEVHTSGAAEWIACEPFGFAVVRFARRDA